ncbi:MAG TPA: hypothetical protein VFL12_08625 [Thermoanaerobaculia bacterium]|nr:hypothetical protein [Thermoanaerobaculia bacterium]
MKRTAAIGAVLLGFAWGCASTDTTKTARSLPETPDPATAKRIAGDWVYAMKNGDHEVDGKLHFAWDGTTVSGNFTGLGGKPTDLADIRVWKDQVAWAIPGDRGTQVIVGEFQKDGTLAGKTRFARKTRNGEGGDSTEPDNGGSGDGSQGGSGGGGSGGYVGGGGGHHEGGRRHGGSRGGSHGQSPSGTWSAVPVPKSPDAS